jgi:hypothetical protein
VDTRPRWSSSVIRTERRSRRVRRLYSRFAEAPEPRGLKREVCNVRVEWYTYHANESKKRRGKGIETDFGRATNILPINM